MHFLGYNRRLDNFLEYEFLRKTIHTINDLETLRDKESKLYIDKKKKEFLDQIELSDEELPAEEEKQHRIATKLKTIAEVQIGKN